MTVVRLFPLGENFFALEEADADSQDDSVYGGDDERAERKGGGVYENQASCLRDAENDERHDDESADLLDGARIVDAGRENDGDADGKEGEEWREYEHGDEPFGIQERGIDAVAGNQEASDADKDYERRPCCQDRGQHGGETFGE